MAEKVLELEDLAVSFDTPQGEVEAVRGVDLCVEQGEILCVVGESGCGKTVMCRSVMHLLPPIARIRRGKITVCGQDITHATEKQMRTVRGSVMSMIFQDPLETLNPTIPVGKQIMEVICRHRKVSGEEAKARTLELLDMVGIENAAERFFLQPHFLSGGMRQRCVIAAALAADPKLLFADEATTALDVTVKSKILDLFLAIREKTGAATVFVTHDLGSVARIADRVAVMYAGKVVEIGTAEEIFYDPRPSVYVGTFVLPSGTGAGEREAFLYSGNAAGFTGSAARRCFRSKKSVCAGYRLCTDAAHVPGVGYPLRCDVAAG